MPNDNLFGKAAIDSSHDCEDSGLFNILPAFSQILSKLEAAKMKYAKDKNLATCINLAWMKMDEYYKKSDDSKVYFIASILDPRVKLCYFELNWDPKWLVGTQEKL